MAWAPARNREKSLQLIEPFGEISPVPLKSTTRSMRSARVGRSVSNREARKKFVIRAAIGPTSPHERSGFVAANA